MLAVMTAAVRSMSERDQTECRLVTQSLPMVASCLTANHKELPASALSCLDALLGEHAHSTSPPGVEGITGVCYDASPGCAQCSIVHAHA